MLLQPIYNQAVAKALLLLLQKTGKSNNYKK